MYHEELDAIQLAPKGAVAHYEAKGWKRVDELEPSIPHENEDGEIDWEEWSDGLDSESSEPLNQEE